MIKKQTNLKSVEVLPQSNAIQVLWVNEIVEDGEVLSSTNHRCSYGKGQQNKFLEEVEGAENYVGLIDWTIEDELTQE